MSNFFVKTVGGMNSGIKKDDTEKLIKKTAKNIFFGEGKFNATTQEIADSAGVNRTLINYYFRSRDNLFNLVFEEALVKEQEKSNAILHSDMPFREKLGVFIEDSMISALQYPYLEIYIVTQMNQGSNYKKKDLDFEKVMTQLEKELETEIKKGNIDPISTIHFMLNLGSLISFPICMRPLLKETIKISDKEFDEILKERKDVILKTIFNN